MPLFRLSPITVCVEERMTMSQVPEVAVVFLFRFSHFVSDFWFCVSVDGVLCDDVIFDWPGTTHEEQTFHFSRASQLSRASR